MSGKEETRIVKVRLARLVRETVDLYVRVPKSLSRYGLEGELGEIYQEYDGADWYRDDMSGEDEGIHTVVEDPVIGVEEADMEHQCEENLEEEEDA